MKASSKLVLGLVSALTLGCTGEDGNIGAVGEDGPTGPGGNSVLVKTTAVVAGSDCANGGIKIELGTDANGNGVLEAGEVTDTQYVCNGGDGSDGGQGDKGDTGDTGGTGLQSLVDTTPLDVDGVCAFGGVHIDYGIDDNDDGNLDTGEIDGFEDVCNACPYNPSVFVKDFKGMGDTDVPNLDLAQVAITGSANLSTATATGLGIVGGTSPGIDNGEVVTFTFDQPVFNLTYDAAGLGRDIVALDKDSVTLGTNSHTGDVVTNISTQSSDSGILSFTDTATADSHSIASIEFTLCP